MSDIEDWTTKKIKREKISLKCIILINFILTLFISISLVCIYLLTISPIIDIINSKMNELDQINKIANDIEILVNIFCQQNNNNYPMCN